MSSHIELVRIPLCVIYLPVLHPIAVRFWTYVRNRHRALLNAIRRFCFVCTTREQLEQRFPIIYLQTYTLDIDPYTLESLVRLDEPFAWFKHLGLKPIKFIRGTNEEFSLVAEELLYDIYLNAQLEGLYRPR